VREGEREILNLIYFSDHDDDHQMHFMEGDKFLLNARWADDALMCRTR